MHVAVAIVGFRNAGDVVECVGALNKSTYRDFVVVVCENGGEDAYEELKNQLSQSTASGTKIICAPTNLGYAGGVNVCIRATPDADAWWVLNPDTLPDSNAMAELVARLDTGDCEAVGSTVRLMDGRAQSYGGYWSPWLGRAVSLGRGTTSGTPEKTEIERRQNYLSGSSMMLSRRFLKTVGFMREDYFLYCEEIEWCLRALKLGMRLGFAPDAVVAHHHSKTMGSFDAGRPSGWLPVYMSERNRILLTKDLFPLLLPIVVAAGIPIVTYRYWIRRGWRYFVYALRGCFAGLRGERGVPRLLNG